MKGILHRADQDKQPEPDKKRHGCLIVAAALFVLGFLSSAFGGEPTKLYTASGKIGQSYTMLESDDGTYYGSVVDLAYSGAGEFQHLSGDTYEGEFAQSKREGEGTFTWSNGDKFVGTWKDDRMVSGTYEYSDGRKYEGTFSYNGFDSGTFTLTKPHDKLGIKTMTCELSSGSITRIQLEMKDGARYDGNLTGLANITYPSGNKYTGQVKDGLRHGEGTFAWRDGGKTVSQYKGGWVSDQMSGQGTYYYTSEDYPRIEGSFTKGKPDGKATYSKESGNTFETTWKDGVCTDVTET